jgi:F420-dependent oxidoreductase-like protein
LDAVATTAYRRYRAPIRLGIHFPNFSLPGNPDSLATILADTAQAAEAGGCAVFTQMDHWFQMEMLGGPAEPMLEGYTSLGFLAGKTERITLGLLVTGVTYRHPGLLAKTVTTLDVLSGGRALLGLGAAWYDREHLGLGVPYPPMAERFERLEETLAVCKQMWSDDDGPYEGRHYRLAETLCLPRPIQQPRPRILIGGGGERKTLRLVARHADACNLFGGDVAGVRHKIDVLHRHCEAEGRDPAEIEITTILRPESADDRDAFVELMAAYAKLGVDLVWLSAPVPDPVAWVTKTAAQLVPRLAELGPR